MVLRTETSRVEVNDALARRVRKKAMDVYGSKKGAMKKALEATLRKFAMPGKADWGALNGVLKRPSFTAKAKVWNVADRAKATEVELTVDTGSTYTVLPASILQRLGVERQRVVQLRIADGTLASRPYGEIGVAIGDLQASATPVLFGNEGVWLLGAVTIEQLGLAPDPVQKRLVTTTALMMSAESV